MANELRAEIVLDLGSLLGEDEYGEPFINVIRQELVSAMRIEIRNVLTKMYKKEIHALAAKVAKQVFFDGDGVTIPPLSFNEKGELL